MIFTLIDEMICKLFTIANIIHYVSWSMFKQIYGPVVMCIVFLPNPLISDVQYTNIPKTLVFDSVSARQCGCSSYTDMPKFMIQYTIIFRYVKTGANTIEKLS